MTKQIIETGSLANDGTGDTLRTGAQKINANFTELYNSIYSLPTAGVGSVGTLGGVKVDGISVVISNGVISSAGTTAPASTTDNAITRFDGTTGRLLQNSVVTISDFGAIVAPVASSVIPFHYDNQAAFPSAVTYHGAIAHSHADGKMYFAHSGAWTALASVNDIPSTAAVLAVTSIDALSDVNTSSVIPTNGQVLAWQASTSQWKPTSVAGAAGGTVISTTVVSANGFAGTVATATSTPAITISTSITGVLKGNGTAISAATSGTDYAPGTSALATGIVKSTTTTGVLTIATAGTDYQAPVSAVGILKSSGVSGNVSAAVSGTDYQSPIGTISGIVKGNGANALTAAVAGTDYQTPITFTTTGSSGAATFNGTALNIPQYTALAARNSTSGTTTSLANNVAGNITITGRKSYMLLSIETSAAAWVTVYTSSAARTADASRTITTDPTPGSGVIAEVITTGASTQIFSPAVFGFSDESSPSTDVQVKVVNRSGGATAITITMKMVQLEI
jgi:hypothetical protein